MRRVGPAQAGQQTLLSGVSLTDGQSVEGGGQTLQGEGQRVGLAGVGQLSANAGVGVDVVVSQGNTEIYAG